MLYKQVDRVAIGSLLSPTFVKVFHVYLKMNWLQNYFSTTGGMLIIDVFVFIHLTGLFRIFLKFYKWSTC